MNIYNADRKVAAKLNRQQAEEFLFKRINAQAFEINNLKEALLRYRMIVNSLELKLENGKAKKAKA